MRDLKEFHDRPWPMVPPLEREAWKKLGAFVKAEHWDGIPTTRVSWDELTHEQRDAAKYLGFSIFTWENCDVDRRKDVQEWVPTTTTTTLPMKDPLRTLMFELKIVNREFSDVSGLQAPFREAIKILLSRALGISQRRVVVTDLREGSIIIECVFLLPDETPGSPEIGEKLPVAAFGDLDYQLFFDQNSTILSDDDMGDYFQDVQLTEVDMEPDAMEKLAEYLAFEAMRGVYDDSNACELVTDAKNGYFPCRKSMASQSLAFFGLVLFMLRG